MKIMSIGSLVEPERAMIMRGPMLHGIIQQFLRQVEWGQLDYLVIDLPPGTGDVPLTLAQSLPLTGAVVVCTPQEVALLDAVRAIAMFRQLKVPMLGMIENMSFFDIAAYLRHRGGSKVEAILGGGGLFDAPGDERAYLFGRGGAMRKAEQMGVPFLGEVPLNILLRERGDEGRIADALRNRARPPGPTSSASSRSSPPRSASRTSSRPRCRSWKSCDKPLCERTGSQMGTGRARSDSICLRSPMPVVTRGRMILPGQSGPIVLILDREGQAGPDVVLAQFGVGAAGRRPSSSRR